jgi:hypothetical protein
MSTPSVKILNLPRLEDNGSNWNTYKERVFNTLTSRGLKRHVTGTIKAPPEIEQRDDGEVYIKGMLKPLTEEEVEELEIKSDEHAQKQAQVRDIIYETISQSTFAQIKGEKTAADLWKKLVTINEQKNTDVYGATLDRLMLMQCSEDDDVRKHITTMTDLKENLAEMGNPLTDEMFSAYIRRSMPKSYKPLFTALAASATIAARPYSSDALIQQIFSMADTEAAAKESDERIETAMAAFREKGNQGSKGQKGGKKKKGPLCANCNRPSHSIENCWRKGGGKEGQAPEWYKEKTGKASLATANSATTSNEEENVVLLSCFDDDDVEDVALAVTSDFEDEAKALSITSEERPIIIDCGASRHFSSDRERFVNFVEIVPSPVRAADGRTFSALGKGDIKLYFPMGEGQKPTPILLTGVYYSPQMAFTLISVSRLDVANHIFHIENGICSISTPKPNSRVIGRIPRVRGLYRVSPQTNKLSNPPTANVASKMMSITELHNRMGHINHNDLRHMVKTGMVTGINLDLESTPDQCTVCIQAKATRKPFPKRSVNEHVKGYGDKIVSDVWGPASTVSLGGHKYYNSYMDLSTHEEKVFFLKQKSEAFNSYKKYEAWAKVQRNAVIKILGTDRGGEFMSNAFVEHLELQGTVRHLTVHDSPQSNGASERANRTHVELARAMLTAANLPRSLWAEAVRHSFWLRNRAPTQALKRQKTPHEMATGDKPDLSNLQPFGADVWVKRLNVGKLEPQAMKARFVGYDDESKGYRIFWPRKNKVSIERDVYFEQTNADPPTIPQIEGETATFDDQQNRQTPLCPKAQNTPEIEKRTTSDPPTASIPTSNETDTIANDPAPQTTQRIRCDGLIEPEPNTGRGFRQRPGMRPGFYKQLTSTRTISKRAEIQQDPEPGGEETHYSDPTEEFAGVIEWVLATIHGEPETLEEALRSDESHNWSAAVENELDQIEKLNTWEIVEAPPDANILKNRYVFRLKRDQTGEVAKHKARLVVKGYSQIRGLDYVDTYAPVIKLTTLRVLLTLAALNGSVIYQADVKNAYLNAELDEVLYMALPPHYEKFRNLPKAPPGKRLVCKLLKGLYGTKQGGRQWYLKLRRKFIDLGYSVCSADEAVFIKIVNPLKYTIVGAAVDDFTIIADSDRSANLIQDQLEEDFELARLGKINWLLGIHIVRDHDTHTISLSQKAYIDQILDRFGLSNASPVVTPMEPGVDLSVDSPAVSPQLLNESEKSRYREAIGSLMYAMLATRPDLAFAVSTLSRFMETPHTTHWKAAQRVFQYLKGTRDLELVLGGDNSELIVYSDADWASQLHRHSISGFASFVGDGAVSWSSKKQPIVTLSSTESEYVALTHAAQEVIWLRKLLSELRNDPESATQLFCDNQGAISLAKDPTFHARTKHIDTKFHFVRQTVDLGHASVQYCPTHEMIADVFTKSLARPKLEKFRSSLGLKPPRSA